MLLAGSGVAGAVLVLLLRQGHLRVAAADVAASRHAGCGRGAGPAGRPLGTSPGLGVLRTSQALPFHCSARASCGPAENAAAVEYEPAAMHADGCQQETSKSTRPDFPGSAGARRRHVLPSHAAAVAGDEPAPWPPTATQLSARGQDMVLRPGS